MKSSLYGTSTYNIWAAMKRRCQTPNDSCYYKYGAKGIKVCDRWQSFDNFYEDMGSRPSLEHSIDRINNTGNYCPENCRWATKLEQAKNKSNNRFLEITINGKVERRIIPEWSRISGVQLWTIRARLKKGIDPYTAVFTVATPYKKFN